MKLKELLKVTTNNKGVCIAIYKKEEYIRQVIGFKSDLDLTTIELNKEVTFITTWEGMIQIKAE